MIRPEDARLQKIMDAFEAMSLNSDELEKIESYLKGDAGEEVLKKLTFRSLENAAPAAANKFRELLNAAAGKKRYEELAKVFQVLFALGMSTCSTMVQGNVVMALRNGEVKKEYHLDSAKLTAVYAQTMGNSAYRFNTSGLQALIDMADGSTESLRRAIDYYKGHYDNGKLLMMTAYLWKKYPNKVVMQKNTPESALKSGIAGALSKLLGGKEASAGTGSSFAIEAADRQILAECEKTIVESIENLFAQRNTSGGRQLSADFIKSLESAVRQGKLTDQILSELKGAAISDFLRKLLGGCAYVNYMMSHILRNMVTLCAAVDTTEAMNMLVLMDARDLLSEQGGEFDTIFKIPTDAMIAWAAERGFNGNNLYMYGSNPEMPKKILKQQFMKNRQAYLNYYKQASFEGGSRMMEVIKEADPGLYGRMLNDGGEAQKEKVIQTMLGNILQKDEVRAFLRGETDIDSLYLLEGKMDRGSKYGGFNEWKILDSYNRSYGDRDFYNRCLVFMAICEIGYFFRQPLFDSKNTFQPEGTGKIFKSLDEGRLDIAHQLHIMVIINDILYRDSDKEMFTNASKAVFTQYLKERSEETKKAFAQGEAYGRYFGLCVLEQETGVYKQEILAFSQDGAKVVKEKLEEILKERPDWRPEVMALLASKKAVERELAIRVMVHWNGAEDTEALKKLYETEKNAKIRSLLESILQPGIGEEGAPGAVKVLTQDELVKNLHKGGKKRTLAWAYETPFSEVHKKNGEQAEEEYLQAILLCYAAMSVPGVNGDARLLAESLNEGEFALYVNELFDKWMETGAEAKKRWVMYIASIHGGSDIVKKLHHQIQEWPLHARGAIAADAVQALALSPQPQALLLVDGIARKFKFKQVKAAAGKALEFAAAQLGLTRDELEDKIVPDLGFDENMERHFDYGERSFTVTITPALEIEIFGEDGKKLKNLPAPGKKDDEGKANAAYESFKEMKKQMKTTVSSQKMRLELALSAERLWSISAWQDLFVKNPVMHQFAIGLIWGVYEDDQLTQSFRYMEDGSFNTEEEDEYTLPQQGYIGLVHPIELTAESRTAWKQQLEDYEIVQPIEQLSRAIYYRTEEESKQKSLERFGGMILNDLSLNGKLQTLGWYRGSVQDAGCFYTFYREDASLGLGVELHFSGSYVGGQGEDVTVYDARFYKAGTITRGSYVYDEADDRKALPLGEIPERYFSEIVLQLTKATASSKEKEADWKAHSVL